MSVTLDQSVIGLVLGVAVGAGAVIIGLLQDRKDPLQPLRPPLERLDSSALDEDNSSPVLGGIDDD